MEVLSVDLFFHLITYLDLNDVISFCSLNKRFHMYGINYQDRWFILIKNRYGDLYSYPQVYQEISSKLPLRGNNYLIYYKIITWMDPVSQCKLKYNCENHTPMVNFITRYIWGGNIYEIYEQEKDIDELNNMDTLLLIRKYKELNFLFKQWMLDEALYTMASNGSVDGIIMMQKLGGNIRHSEDASLHRAANLGYLDVVKYLLDEGADINGLSSTAFAWAFCTNQMSMCRYLLSRGSKIPVGMITLYDPKL